MSLVNSNMNALAASASGTQLSLKLSERSKAKAAESQAAAAEGISFAKGHKDVVDRVEEMILDIESYKEELNKSLEALASSLSDLDQGVEHIESLTIKNKQEDPAILTVREQKDPFEQMFEELFRELNKYGAGILEQVQSNVSAERALSLLEI